MRRRDFIIAAGASGLLSGLAPGCTGQPEMPDSRRLVDTPEKRRSYLEKMLKELVTGLGPRWVGTPSMEKAEQIVRRELVKACPFVTADPITFERWELVGEPSFVVGDTRIEHYPSHGTGGTPDGGVTGVLRKSGTQRIAYDVVDPSTDEILARVTLSPKKWAAPRPYWFYDDETGGMANVNVGNPDVPVLEKAVAEKTRVTVDYQVKFTPGMTTANIIGKIPGESTDEIVLYAHLDSVYNSPGANDNAASVIFVLMLAHAFSGRRHRKTLTFMATTGEEYGYLGTKHLAERLTREGTLNDIKYIFDFDGVTWGPDMNLLTRDEELVALISDIDRDLGLDGTPRWRKSEGVGRESLPLKEAGLTARGIVVDSVPDNEINELCWHRPDDRAEYIRFEPVEIAFNLFRELVIRLDGEGE